MKGATTRRAHSTCRDPLPWHPWQPTSISNHFVAKVPLASSSRDAPLSPAAWLQPPLDNMGRGADAPARGNVMGPPPRPPPPRPINFIQEAQRAYLFGGTPHLASVLSGADLLTKPVMLIIDGPSNGTIAEQNDSLRSKLKQLKRPPEFLQAESPEGQNLPGARAKTFRRIGEFFNLNLYDFGVKIGPTKEIK